MNSKNSMQKKTVFLFFSPSSSFYLEKQQTIPNFCRINCDDITAVSTVVASRVVAGRQDFHLQPPQVHEPHPKKRFGRSACPVNRPLLKNWPPAHWRHHGSYELNSGSGRIYTEGTLWDSGQSGSLSLQLQNPGNAVVSTGCVECLHCCVRRSNGRNVKQMPQECLAKCCLLRRQMNKRSVALWVYKLSAATSNPRGNNVPRRCRDVVLNADRGLGFLSTHLSIYFNMHGACLQCPALPMNCALLHKITQFLCGSRRKKMLLPDGFLSVRRMILCKMAFFSPPCNVMTKDDIHSWRLQSLRCL